MEAAAKFGLWNLILPLFFWVPLFAVIAGLLGLSTLRRMRKQLVATGRETRLPTALVGILLLVLVPIGAGALGGSFAFKRGMARVIENGGEHVVSWSVSHGGASLQSALGIQDPHKKLSASDVRSLLAMYLAGDPKHDQLEQAFYRACDVALAHTNRELSWDELMVGARLAMHASSHQLLTRAAAPLRAAANFELILLGILLVLLHAGTLTIVWFVCRKRLTVEA